ncbi:T9SS type A sorting domain-containing protein [Paludibacter sp. 221]|uniref:pectate lyase family protein n=1 Tax=Paludibacter sp. 221 TaxID=2302939 RepID=UPI0013D3A463|nr:T9SS type A sorting domain-containing protein [Paludibacter sp. 221]
MRFLKPFYLLLFILAANNIAPAQDYYMSSPIGFGRNATGGGNSSIVTVNTRSALVNALKASGSAIIIVTGNISFGENEVISEVVTNKTLLGLKGVKLITTAQTANGGILNLKEGSNNVIIRNLIFEGPGAYDVDGRDLLSNVGCNNLWVDHCEFYDGVDGNFDNTKKSDNITISWCRFGYNKPAKAGGSGGSDDHRFSNLVGGSSSDYPGDGHYSITFQYCYWGDGCRQRMPRARNAELHMLNCYYNTNVSDALAIGLEDGTKGTTCYVEGTNFKKVKRVVDRSYGGDPDVTFVNCLSGGTSAGNVVTKPTYQYAALDVTQVEAAVTSSCGAGATLDVTLTGEISSPCGSQPPLTIPTNVNATSAANSITVSWSPVENATGYKVKVCYDDKDENNSIIKQWDFTNWTINEDNADANLIIDEKNTGRFNYNPSTKSEELKFANGKVIPDTEGLLFTAAETDKLRLGFATQLVYLNGTGIKIKIPCQTGYYITIEGMSGNASKTDRGFSATGATVDTKGTSSNISSGIITEAGASGTWSYVATADAVEITTIGGGMNIQKITISTGVASSTVCNEYEVTSTETSKLIDGLTEGVEYTYQVKALRDDYESDYSASQTIITSGTSGYQHPQAEWYIVQEGNRFRVEGIEADKIILFDFTGKQIISSVNSQTIDITGIDNGLYIISVETKTNRTETGKVLKYN